MTTIKGIAKTSLRYWYRPTGYYVQIYGRPLWYKLGVFCVRGRPIWYELA